MTVTTPSPPVSNNVSITFVSSCSQSNSTRPLTTISSSLTHGSCLLISTPSISSLIPSSQSSTVPVSASAIPEPILDPEAPSFAPTVQPPPPCDTQTGRKSKSKKDVMKDPKDIEIDFLKRELNIVKLHLLEQEAEVKDLTRKNKVLSETVSIFENAKQSELSSKYTSGSSPLSTPASTNVPLSSPSSSHTADSQTILEPNVINKLLDLLSDLVKRFSGAIPCTESLSPSTLSKSLATTESVAPVVSNTNNVLNNSHTTRSQVPTTTPLSSVCIVPPASPSHAFPDNPAPNISVNSLDEFASDLSMETCEQEEDALNSYALTTQ